MKKVPKSKERLLDHTYVFLNFIKLKIKKKPIHSVLRFKFQF